MSGPDSSTKVENLSELRMLFARNLDSLVSKERSVSDCARKLRISRSQLNRFLSGETYPRPDVLQRLCLYFGTDARILTTSLADLARVVPQIAPSGLLPSLFGDIEPVSHSVLPDGIYAEWMLSTTHLDTVEMHLFRIYTEDGRRIGKVRLSISDAMPGMRRYRYPMLKCVAQYFMQRAGFASIDRVADENFHAFTAFRVGYGSATGVYPGFKLSGISHDPKRYFSRIPCMLQRVAGDTKSLLAAARVPEFMIMSDAPQIVQRILKDVHGEADG